MKNEMGIRLLDHGRQLITRQEGSQVRSRILNLLEKNEVIFVDFAGIELITPSFADECLGMLAVRLGGDAFKARVRLRGAAKGTKHLIAVVLANRLMKTKSRGESASPRDI